MKKSSRYVRPARPSAGVRLQVRDHDVIRSIGRFRTLEAEHIRQLHFPQRSLRFVQRRLRQLWEHTLIDRVFRPVVMGGGAADDASTPVYVLGKGARPLRADNATRAPYAKPSVATLAHGLIATDFLIAIEGALRDQGEANAMLHPEAELWHAARRAPAEHIVGGGIVPDGAVTIALPNRRPETFAVEIVRADPRGGLRTLIKKFFQYRVCMDRGFFRRAYGWANLRAVLVALPTQARAVHLSELAAKAKVPGFIWFGTYERERPAFRKEMVLRERWQNSRGRFYSIVPDLDRL